MSIKSCTTKKVMKAYFSGFEKNSSSKQSPQNQTNVKNKANTLLQYNKDERCIQFLSDGGHQFSVPMDVDVQVIHILTEGILIGWNREGEFSYCTLGTYPMESISPLGVLNNENVDLLLQTQEQIIYASRKIPIVVMYNSALQRHTISLIRTNTNYRPETINELQFFPSLLNSNNQARIVCDTYFEESSKESQIIKCKIIRGLSDTEMIFCMLYSGGYVKLLQFNILDLQEFSQRRGKKSNSIVRIYQTMQNVQVMNNISDFSSFNLYAQIKTYNTVNFFHEHHKNLNNPQLKQIQRARNQLKNSLIVYHKSNKLTLIYGSKIILNYTIQVPIKTIDIISKSVHILLESKLIIQTQSSRFECDSFSQIRDKILISSLQAIQLVTDGQQFSLLLRDVLVNCIVNYQLKYLIKESSEFKY